MSPALENHLQSAAKAWHWWISELEACFPSGAMWRTAPRSLSALFVLPNAVRLERTVDDAVELYIDDVPIEELSEESWTQLASLTEGSEVRLVLAQEDVHVIQLTLPRAARSRQRSAASLQLDHFAPIRSDLLIWDIISSEIVNESVCLKAIMAKTNRVARLREILLEHGIECAAVYGSSGDECWPLLLELPRQLQTSVKSVPRHLLYAVSAFLLILLSVLPISAAMIALNRSEIEILAKSVHEKQLRETPLLEAERVRAALATVYKTPPVINQLEELTKVMPISAEVEKFGHTASRSMYMEVRSADVDGLLSDLAAFSKSKNLTISEQSKLSDGNMSVRFASRTAQ